MNEIVFEVSQDQDGGFVAECLTEAIFTQADSWDELRINVRDVVSAYYYDTIRPRQIRLHLVRDELVPT